MYGVFDTEVLMERISEQIEKCSMATIGSAGGKNEMLDITVCSKCGSDKIAVNDSRKIHGVIRRRRKCLDCGKRTITCEISERDYEELLKIKSNMM